MYTIGWCWSLITMCWLQIYHKWYDMKGRFRHRYINYNIYSVSIIKHTHLNHRKGTLERRNLPCNRHLLIIWGLILGVSFHATHTMHPHLLPFLIKQISAEYLGEVHNQFLLCVVNSREWARKDDQRLRLPFPRANRTLNTSANIYQHLRVCAHLY